MRTVVEVSAAFVALFAATAYALGLVGLFLQVAIHHTDGIEGVSAAWYAASLAPRTVTAGQGALHLLLPLVRTASITIALALFLLLLRAVLFPLAGRLFGRPWGRLLVASGLEKRVESFVQRPVPRHFAERIEHYSTSYLEHGNPKRPFLAVLGTASVAYFSLFICFAAFALTAIGGAPGALDLLQALAPWVESVSVLLVVTAMILLAVPLDERGYALRRVNRRGVLATVVIVYFGAALVAFVQASAVEPPLPEAELANGTKGELLGHADGYWYLMEADGAVSAVPDDEAGDVHIQPRR